MLILQSQHLTSYFTFPSPELPISNILSKSLEGIAINLKQAFFNLPIEDNDMKQHSFSFLNQCPETWPIKW